MTNSYCAAPWRGLHINFRGDVKTCCAGDPNMLGDLNHHTIEEILHSDALQEIKRTIQSGQLHPKYCANCIKAERYGRSERHWHNDVNPDFDPLTADLDEHRPSIVDVRWNNTCNLACNYCGPYCSSKWAAKMKIEYRSGARPYHEQVCDYLEINHDHVREVALVGGEPLLLPENERVLDVIPTDCIVTLITNMNVDFSTNVIVGKLAKRNRVGWSMSFDNVGPRFEYVRYHGRWPLLEQNVAKVLELMQTQGHWGGIHAVYNVYNCTRLVEFREWAHERGLTIVWQTLYQPECLDPLQHGSALRDLARAEAARLLDQCGSYMEASEISFFEHAMKNLEQEPVAADRHRELLREHQHTIETRYHPDSAGDFRRLWPELAFILD